MHALRMDQYMHALRNASSRAAPISNAAARDRPSRADHCTLAAPLYKWLITRIPFVFFFFSFFYRTIGDGVDVTEGEE